MKIDLVINVKLPSVAPSEKPESTLNLMKQNHVRCLPVVDKGRFKGMVSDEKLLEHLHDQVQLKSPGNSKPTGSIQKLIEQGTQHLTLNTHISEAIRLFAQTEHDIIPVLKEDKTYIGCVLEKELMDMAGELLSVYETGSTLELQFSGHDFSLSEVIKVIEDNQARLISMNSLPGLPGSNHHRIEMKLNVMDGTRIALLLNRAGYSVRLQGQDELGEEKEFRERIEELMRFIES